jgi:hypothetical protein
MPRSRALVAGIDGKPDFMLPYLLLQLMNFAVACG